MEAADGSDSDDEPELESSYPGEEVAPQYVEPPIRQYALGDLLQVAVVEGCCTLMPQMPLNSHAAQDAASAALRNMHKSTQSYTLAGTRLGRGPVGCAAGGHKFNCSDTNCDTAQAAGLGSAARQQLSAEQLETAITDVQFDPRKVPCRGHDDCSG